MHFFVILTVGIVVVVIFLSRVIVVVVILVVVSVDCVLCMIDPVSTMASNEIQQNASNTMMYLGNSGIN